MKWKDKMRHKKKSKIILKKDRRFIGKNQEEKPKYKYEGRKNWIN